jgi:hypothetical protein
MNYKHLMGLLGLRAAGDLAFGPNLRPEGLIVSAAGAVISLIAFTVVMRGRDQLLHGTAPSLRTYVSIAYSATLVALPLLPVGMIVGGWAGYWMSWAGGAPLAAMLYLSGGQLPAARTSPAISHAEG